MVSPCSGRAVERLLVPRAGGCGGVHRPRRRTVALVSRMELIVCVMTIEVLINSRLFTWHGPDYDTDNKTHPRSILYSSPSLYPLHAPP